MVKERHQVAAITFKAWDLVCQTRDCKGLQIAPYLSRDMATRLKVDTLTEVPGKGTKKSVMMALKSQVYLHISLSISALHRFDIKGQHSEGKEISCTCIFLKKLFIPSLASKRIKGSKERYLRTHLMANF